MIVSAGLPLFNHREEVWAPPEPQDGSTTLLRALLFHPLLRPAALRDPSASSCEGRTSLRQPKAPPFAGPSPRARRLHSNLPSSMQYIQYRDPVVHHHWPSTLSSLPPAVHDPALHATRSLPTPTATATAPDPTHSGTSGWRIAIHLDREGRPPSWDNHSSKWRSGETLKGRVELSQVAPAAAPITSVIVRSFWQSTTTFVTSAISAPSMARMMGKDDGVRGRVVEHGEFHRGYLEAGGEGVELWEAAEELELLRREVERDFPLLGGPATPLDLERREVASRPADVRDPSGPLSFDFTFLIPTSTRSTFSNSSPSAPANRGILINFMRTPPPSFATTNGSVQWFVEVLLRTEEAPTATQALPDDLPTFGSAIEDGAASDFRGLLQPSASLTIKRTEFPFEPLDNHVQDFNSHWTVHGGPIWPPTFGRDARDELGGSTLAKDVGRLVAQDGGSDRWTTYEKEVSVKSPLGFGRASGVLRTEVSSDYSGFRVRS